MQACGGCAGRALARVAGERRAGSGLARAEPGAGGRGKGVGGSGRAAGGCVPESSSFTLWLARSSAPFLGGNPGRVVAVAAYVSAVSRRGRAGRPGGRERSLGGRVAGAEPGGGPRRVGGQGRRQLQPGPELSCPSRSCPACAAAGGGAR